MNVNPSKSDMPYEPDDHARFRDDIGAYLAGGLDDDERRAFESHPAACPDCAAALSDAAAEERKLQDMFANALPAEGFEDRILGRFRSGAAAADRWRMTTYLHPAVRRAAVGAAAVVMLAGFGYVASQQIDKGGLPTPLSQGSRIFVAKDLRQIGAGLAQGRNENKGAGLSSRFASRDSNSPASPSEMAQSFNKSLSDTLGRRTEPAQDAYLNTSANGRWQYAFRQPPKPDDLNDHVALPEIQQQVGKDFAKAVPGGRPGAVPGGYPGMPGAGMPGGAGYGGFGGGGGFGASQPRGNESFYAVVPPAAADNLATGAKPGSAPPDGETLAKRESVRGDVSGKNTDLSLAYRGFKPADQQAWGRGLGGGDDAKKADAKVASPDAGRT